MNDSLLVGVLNGLADQDEKLQPMDGLEAVLITEASHVYPSCSVAASLVSLRDFGAHPDPEQTSPGSPHCQPTGFPGASEVRVSLTNAVQEPGASHATQLRCSLEEGILAVRIVHRLG